MDGVGSGFLEELGGFDGLGEREAAFLSVFFAGYADQDASLSPTRALTAEITSQARRARLAREPP